MKEIENVTRITAALLLVASERVRHAIDEHLDYLSDDLGEFLGADSAIMSMARVDAAKLLVSPALAESLRVSCELDEGELTEEEATEALVDYLGRRYDA
jgi:hypothetical protein